MALLAQARLERYRMVAELNMDMVCRDIMTGRDGESRASLGIDPRDIFTYAEKTAQIFVNELRASFALSGGSWKDLTVYSDLYTRLNLREPNIFSEAGSEALCVDVKPDVQDAWKETAGSVLQTELLKFSNGLDDVGLPNRCILYKNGAVLVMPW